VFGEMPLRLAKAYDSNQGIFARTDKRIISRRIGSRVYIIFAAPFTPNFSKLFFKTSKLIAEDVTNSSSTSS